MIHHNKDTHETILFALCRGKRTHVVTSESTPKRPRMNGFQRQPSAGAASSPTILYDTEDSDDDIVILETESTPKPNKPRRHLNKVKQEKKESDDHITVLLECSDDAAVDVPSEETAAGTSTEVEAGHPAEVVSSTTQTAAVEVKEEPHSQKQTEEGRDVCGTNGTDQISVPDNHTVQQNEDNSPCQNQDEQGLTNGEAHVESDETPGPSSLQQFSNVPEVQQKQDQLPELLQDAAQERDSLKQEVQRLTVQLQELSHVSVKKECAHQACQTQDQKDYKSLFEKAKQKISDLIKDKEAFTVAAEARTSLNADRDEERDVDEISLQVGCLVHELDQTTKERDELRSQVRFTDIFFRV